jgi:Methyltransferase domain
LQQCSPRDAFGEARDSRLQQAGAEKRGWDLSGAADAAKAHWRRRWRMRRMQELLARLAPGAGATVLDLGGSVGTWEQFEHTFDVTLLNVDEAHAHDFRAADPAHNRYRVAVGDACDLGRYEDASFDLVFSNSVIEHIGDAGRVARFAREVRRVGRSYWVQTPSWLFPIEAHTGLPFFWLYPAPLREALVVRHDRRYAMNPWSCPMAQTRCFRLRELRALFPDAAVYTERVAGFAKSWSLYRRAPCA